MPGLIPTQYQRTPLAKSSYSDEDLTSDKPGLAGLYNAAKQAQLEAETYQRLNAGGTADPKDALVADAERTLASTQPTAARLANVGADEAAAKEQYRTEGEASPIRPFANAAKTVGGVGMFANMIPGGQAVGLPSEVLYGLGSAANAMDPYSHADAGERLSEGAQAGLAAAPFAWRAAKAMPGAARMNPFVEGSAEIPMGMSSKQSSIPPVEHYWDALDLGQTPAKAAKIAAGRDKASLSALKSLQAGGEAGRANRAARLASNEVDLTGELGKMAEPLSGQEVNAARSQERFGKSFKNEGAPANSMPSRNAKPVPMDKDGFAPYKNANQLMHQRGTQAYIDSEYAKNHALAVKLLGDAVRTPEELAARKLSKLGGK